MSATAKAAPPRAKTTGKKRQDKKRRRRAWWLAAPIVLLAWAGLCHLVIRPKVEQWVESRFAGTARVGWAVLWPDLDVTLYSVSLRGERFEVEASDVAVDTRAWGLFGGKRVHGVEVNGMRAEVVHGGSLGLMREPVQEGDAVPEQDGLDLDPTQVAPLTFRDPRVTLRTVDETYPVFSTDEVTVRQVGDRSFAIETNAGAMGRLPFEKMTARLIPRGNHVLLNDLKLRAFNGMMGGVIDLDTSQVGSLNGDLEWHFVEIEAIWKTYGLPYAEKRRGDLSGRVVFRGDRPRVEALSGTGTVRMTRARFFSPVGFKVFLTLKVPVAAESMLTSGEMKFSFEKSLFYMEEAKANATGFELEGRGIISFDGAADLEVGHAGTHVRVSGRLEDPDVKVLPLSGITLPFDRMFRERVKR